MLLGIIIAVLVTLPIWLLTSRAKYKARATTLEEMVQKDGKIDERSMDTLERLQKLRENGTLTEEEFEKKKKKVLG